MVAAPPTAKRLRFEGPPALRQPTALQPTLRSRESNPFIGTNAPLEHSSTLRARLSRVSTPAIAPPLGGVSYVVDETQTIRLVSGATVLRMRQPVVRKPVLLMPRSSSSSASLLPPTTQSLPQRNARYRNTSQAFRPISVSTTPSRPFTVPQQRSSQPASVAPQLPLRTPQRNPTPISLLLSDPRVQYSRPSSHIVNRSVAPPGGVEFKRRPATRPPVIHRQCTPVGVLGSFTMARQTPIKRTEPTPRQPSPSSGTYPPSCSYVSTSSAAVVGTGSEFPNIVSKKTQLAMKRAPSQLCNVKIMAGLKQRLCDRMNSVNLALTRPPDRVAHIAPISLSTTRAIPPITQSTPITSATLITQEYSTTPSYQISQDDRAKSIAALPPSCNNEVEDVVGNEDEVFGHFVMHRTSNPPQLDGIQDSDYSESEVRFHCFRSKVQFKIKFLPIHLLTFLFVLTFSLSLFIINDL